jgi:hypothetical protein
VRGSVVPGSVTGTVTAAAAGGETGETAGPDTPIETPTQMAALTMRRVTVEVIVFHTGELIAERAGRWCPPTAKRGPVDTGLVPDTGRVPRSITGVMAERSPS